MLLKSEYFKVANSALSVKSLSIHDPSVIVASFVCGS